MGKFPPESLNSPGNFCWCKFLNVVPALLADTVGFSEGVCKEHVAAGCDFRDQNIPKCVCGRDFAPDHTPRLQSSQTPYLVFRKPLCDRGGEGRKEEKGRVAFSHFCLYNLTSGQYCSDIVAVCRSVICRNRAD